MKAILEATDADYGYVDRTILRSSNESKDRLLASVSHEIRTPLTAIVGLSEEISTAGDSLSREDLDELNAIIVTQSRELAELVEDLLIASRADFGNLSIRTESVDLRAQAERVAKSIRDSQRTDKVIEIGGDTCVVMADPLRVRQILRNLLTNAIRYGGERIVLVVEQLVDSARLVVADDGCREYLPGRPSSSSRGTTGARTRPPSRVLWVSGSRCLDSWPSSWVGDWST